MPLAGEHGVAESTIHKRASKEDWSRDLGAKIQAKAATLIRSAAVRNAVRTATRIAECAIVDANADVMFQVRLSQRADIACTTWLFRALLAELEAQTGNLDLFLRLGEAMDTSGTDDNGRPAATA
ncbi:hypothetical protein WKW80_05670 [Variovorax humicola]|uniref:Uncharacterized protein n=1 Tax=Variovorax humicola TaxID=1769758 RepID=A0ABU8VWB7_9BURK